MAAPQRSGHRPPDAPCSAMNQTRPPSDHRSATGALSVPALLPLEPLELLAGRSRRLADLVESVSRRRDVRELRARLLVLLLELRCPVKGRPRRPWYVPGAVARLGVEAMRRAWRGFYGLEAPCPRTIRSHLGVLERVLAVVRQPGDWVELDRPAGEWRPRHADTLHVLEDDEAVAAWVEHGAELVRRHPETRTNPDAWRRRVGAWRRRPRAVQLELFEGGRAEGLPDRVGERREQGEALAASLGVQERAGARDALELLRVGQDAGVVLRGRPSFELAQDRPRLAGALALLARALVRGDAVRSTAAWLVRAYRHAGRTELEAARRWVVGYGSDPGGGPQGPPVP